MKSMNGMVADALIEAATLRARGFSPELAREQAVLMMAELFDLDSRFEASLRSHVYAKLEVQTSADVFHIRRPLRRAGGSQFYRDKSDRGQGTYCGASETSFDIGPNDRAVAFNGRTPCAACVRLGGNRAA
jgi:hypothetical protein